MALFLLSSCASVHAPYGFLPPGAKSLQKESYGSWIELHVINNRSKDFMVSGELIAVSNDSVFVLDQNIFRAVSVFDIQKARLVEYNSHASELGPLVLLGALSTASHGFYLFLTAPLLWILGGSLAVSSRSRDPILDYPKHSFAEMSKFARFPQGLPKNLNRDELRSKPFETREIGVMY